MNLFRKTTRAQSFIEFALIIPILLLVLLGVVELTLYMGTYINLVDLTREAARFASNRDPFPKPNIPVGDKNCNTNETSHPPDPLNFYWDTACIFSPLSDPRFPADPFHNGFNSTLGIKPAEDDILISVFTETGVLQPNGRIDPQITDNTATNPWVWSNEDADDAHNDNWRRECNRLTTPAALTPAFTREVMERYLDSNPYPAQQAMANKGFVVVEAMYCYHQILNIPILAQFLPNPIRIHAYTIMPLPAAQPTPTPRP